MSIIFGGSCLWSVVGLTMQTFNNKTRLDTRPPVADGWAGAEMRIFPLFSSSMTDQPTNRPTNGRTDKASYRVASPRLNIKKTKPDTRPIPVADGWAGAETISIFHFSTCADGPTDQRTDRRTDKASYRVASPRLKMKSCTRRSYIRLSI